MTTLDTLQTISYSQEGKRKDKMLTPEQTTRIVRGLVACCDNLFSIAQDQYHPTDPRIAAIRHEMDQLFSILTE